MLAAAAVLLIVGLLVMLWHAAYGWCRGCGHQREPRCECPDRTPNVRRPRWKL